MFRKIKSINESKFVKNVIVVMSGTAMAQIITFISMPLITRLYGPESIGILGAFTAIVSILAPMAALTYPIAIVLPKSNSKARAIAKLAASISLVVGGIMTILLLFVSEPIISLFSLNSISSFLYLLPIIVILTGFSQVMDQWLIRTKYFKVKAKTTIFQAIFMNGSKIGMGFIYPVSASLVIIQTLGVFFRAFLMFFLSDKSIVNKDEVHTFKDIKKVARDNIDFPKYRAPQVLINAFSQGFPIILFATLFSPAIAGFYSLGRQALNTPIQLIGNAVQDVLYPKINELANKKKKITPIILKAVLGLFALGIIPFSIVIFWGPSIFSFVFGKEWITAGEYARWIGLVALFMLITRPVIVSIPVLNIQRNFLFVEIVGTIAKIGAILVGVYLLEEAIYAVILFSIASALMYIYLTVHTLLVSSRFDKLNNP